MKLAAYLKQNGIKRNALAKQLEVSPQTITGWCDGTFWPSRENVSRLFTLTGGAVTPTDFLNLRPEPERPPEPERAA